MQTRKKEQVTKNGSSNECRACAAEVGSRIKRKTMDKKSRRPKTIESSAKLTESPKKNRTLKHFSNVSSP